MDGLRGMLSLAVAVSHAYGHILGWDTGYKPIINGSFAVDIFFMMSGFVLFYAYHRKKISFQTYFIHRIFRLWPLHFAASLFVMLGFYLSIGQILAPFIGDVENTSKLVFYDLTLTSSLGIFGDFGTINQPSWSISVELYVVSVVAILAVFFQQKGRFLLWIFMLMLVIAGFYGMLFRPVAGGHEITRGIFSDGVWRALLTTPLGIVSFFIFRAWPQKIPTRIPAYIALGVILFFIMTPFEPKALYFIALGILTLTLPAFFLDRGDIFQIFSGNIFTQLGQHSYSIYLIHTPIIYALIAINIHLDLPKIILANLAILLTIGLSWLSFRFIEQPAITFSKKSFKS